MPSAVVARAAPPHRRGHHGLRAATWLLALGTLVPIGVILGGWLRPDAALWRHLADTVLWELLANTALLVLGVGSGSALLGVSLAWLVVMCRFPGRRVFEWALMLPLAIPAYVLAVIAIGLLDFSGPLQGALRAWLGPGQWLPPIRSLGGVIGVLTLAFYPYVYMLARAAFIGQGRAPLEAARVLGCSPLAACLRVAIPGARPAIAAGVALVLMETLADFGTVATFNVDTFTTAIYKAWFGLFNLPVATQLASVLLLIVLVGLFGERRARSRARYHGGGRPARDDGFALRGARACAASAYCATVLGLAFVLPLGQLLVWAWSHGALDFDARYLALLWHTLLLGASAALLTVAGALVLAYAHRRLPDRATAAAAVRCATLGYALPGSVLAVGIMVGFTWIDGRFALLLDAFGLPAQALLRGSVWALLLAYLVRFLAVAYGPVDSGLERIRPSLIEAARGLGAGSREVFARVYLPLLRPGVFSAALLVLVDVMKEQPATLMLRPFGWDTLAVRIFELTSEGEWQRAALPALALVAVGLLPVIQLLRKSGT
ncbi:iron(III) transport system permease protein [Plasticicumulans lactativorans]|uniref:Iron(III) transport system permease protein n=2 Tax=Plasticicumulans lactativorans TaxID=1133106 RepID=A0A4R2L4K9_9GAMM|nr:iron(III) transport system permease protein [Plasticicumulans lactativorans]